MSLPSIYSFERTTTGLVFQENFDSDGSLFAQSAWTGGLADSGNSNPKHALVANSVLSYAPVVPSPRIVMNNVNEASFAAGHTSGLTEMVVQAQTILLPVATPQFIQVGLTSQAFTAVSPCYMQAHYIVGNAAGAGGEFELNVITNGTRSLITRISQTFSIGTSLLMKMHTRDGFQKVWLDGVLQVESDNTANDSSTSSAVAGTQKSGGGFFGLNYANIDDFRIYSGNGVVITGVPAEHYIQLGSKVSQVDGSTVTMEFDGDAFPFSIITLSSFDSSEPTRLSTVTAFTTDVYGGDSFSLSLLSKDDWEKPIQATRPNPWGLLSKTTEQGDVDFLLRVKSQYAHQTTFDTRTAVRLHESVISI